MFRYDSICDDDDVVILSAIVDLETGKRDGIAIEFKTLKNKNYPDQTLMWDNDDYIFGKFYKFLKRWKKGELKKNDPKKFNDIWGLLTYPRVEELINMLEYAIKEKWYEPETE